MAFKRFFIDHERYKRGPPKKLTFLSLSFLEKLSSCVETKVIYAELEKRIREEFVFSTES